MFLYFCLKNMVHFLKKYFCLFQVSDPFKEECWFRRYNDAIYHNKSKCHIFIIIGRFLQNNNTHTYNCTEILLVHKCADEIKINYKDIEFQSTTTVAFYYGTYLDWQTNVIVKLCFVNINLVDSKFSSRRTR